MCDDAAEDEGRVEGQRHDEGVEEPVVAFAHTVPHPRAVMVETLHTVVTLAAVRGAWSPKHLTGGAILEFDKLLVDEDLLSARRGLVAKVSTLIDLPLDVCGLVWGGSRQDSRVTEARLQQSDENEYEKHCSDYRDAAGYMFDQEGTIKYEEEPSGDEDQAQGEGEDPCVPGHYDASIAEEAVLPGEYLPLSPGSTRSGSPLLRGSLLIPVPRWRVARSGHGKCLRVYLLIVAGFHVRPEVDSITDRSEERITGAVVTPRTKQANAADHSVKQRQQPMVQIQ